MNSKKRASNSQSSDSCTTSSEQLKRIKKEVAITDDPLFINHLCTNCNSIKAYMDAKFNEITDLIVKENTKVQNTLREQRVLLNNLLMQNAHTNKTVDVVFPLQTEGDLIAFDQLITPENTALYEQTLHSLVRGNPLKNIKYVLSTEIALDYNLDGTHGKKRFRDFKNVFDVLKSTIPGPNPEQELRKAFQMMKKRYFKVICMERKKAKELQETIKFETLEFEENDSSEKINF